MHAMWLIFVVTLVASLVLTPLARCLAARFNVVDAPDGKRKLQSSPVPLWGGVAVYLALVSGLAAVQISYGSLLPSGFYELAWVIVAAAGFVCLLGGVDDSRDLNPKFKLLLQIVSVLPVVLAGWLFENMDAVDSIALFGYQIELGWWGVPLTVCWLVGCINALNLLDGMDGLASIVGLSTAAILAFIATAMGHHHVALASLALCGALAGFLVYNLPPAKIYLGDSGSMVIGLVVGVLSIQASIKTAATLSITVPAVLMTIPLLDTALAIVRRKLTGQRFDAPDRGHIHHRLLDRGLSDWQALCIIGSLCLATGAAAAAAAIFRSDALAWIVALVLVVSLIRMRTFGHHEVSLVKVQTASLLSRWAVRLAVSSRRARPSRLRSSMTNFEDAWNALADEAALCQADRLQLTVNVEGKGSRQRIWSDAQQKHGDENRWELSFTFADGSSRRCRLDAQGRRASGVEPWYLLHLANLMQTYGAHWLARPDEVPLLLSLPPTSDPLASDARSEAA